MSRSDQQGSSLLPNFLFSAFAACVGEVASLPFDTVKVRLMIQAGTASRHNGSNFKYKGVAGTMLRIVKEEGFSSLWKGMVPGLHRQIVFGGLRFGLYEPAKEFVAPLGGPPILQKIVAGLATGALAITLASPTDLVKVRLQTQSQNLIDSPMKYASALAAYPTIIKEEGVLGLWVGYGPNLVRNSIMSCIELGTYDVCKETLINFGLPDTMLTHFLSGLSSGFMACVVACPADVVKSRIMADTTCRYTGLCDCATKTLFEEGPTAFYKGFVPYFARVGCFLVTAFITLEQAKSAYARSKN